MKKFVGMMGFGACRCEACGLPYLYTWLVCSSVHFPLPCVYCDERAVLRIEFSELSNADKLCIVKKSDELLDELFQ